MYFILSSSYDHLFYVEYENICTLSYHHPQIENMAHFVLFMVSSWNNDMRGMSFYILMDISIGLLYQIQNDTVAVWLWIRILIAHQMDIIA